MDEAGQRLGFLTRRGALLAGLGAAAAAAVPGTASAADADSVTLVPQSSARNVVQAGAPSVIPLSVRGAASQTASLQQWQDSAGNVLASLSGDGRVFSLASATGAPARLTTFEIRSPDGLADHVTTLSYNRYFQNGAWHRDDPTREATAFQLESWWNGSAELNWDIQSPDGVERRPLGMVAAYDGSVVGFNVGKDLAPGAAGVEIWGGTKPDVRQLRLYERLGGNPNDNIVLAFRGDRATTSFAWKGGGTPRWIFALDGKTNALGVGAYGILKFVKPFVQPIIVFDGTGTGQQLIASTPVTGEAKPRFTLYADGKQEWGPGTAVDANLYRAAPGLLRTDNALQAAGLATRVGVVPPADADYLTPVDGMLAVDNQAGLLYARLAGVWKAFAPVGGDAPAAKALSHPPSDADFARPADGLLAVDTSANVLYVRSGGAWRSAALA